MFASILLALATRNAILLPTPTSKALADHDGRVVTVLARRATMPWQHPVRDLQDDHASYVDLVLGTQTVAYADEPFPCSHQAAEITARVRTHQSHDSARPGGLLEEAQLEVLTWTCVANTAPPARKPMSTGNTFAVKPRASG